MSEAKHKNKTLALIIAIIVALALAAWLALAFGNPQWHWRVYVHQAAKAANCQLDPPAGFSGVWINWGEGGIIRSRVAYQNGVKNGAYTTYNTDGSVLGEGSFVNNQLDGPQKTYQDGGIYIENTYDTGRLVSTYLHRNGQKDGPYTVYSESGEILSEGHYAADELDGIQIVHHPGGIRSEVPYTGGKRDGVEKSWYPSGNLAVEAPWINGVQEGNVEFYYENGSIQSSIPFYQGKREGVMKSWYEDGTPQSDESYRDDMKNGPSKYWTAEGGLDMSLNFRSDVMDGVQTWYHPNGGKAREIRMYMATPHGEWKEWDENGKLVEDDIYDMGELVKKQEPSKTEPEEANSVSGDAAEPTAEETDEQPDATRAEEKTDNGDDSADTADKPEPDNEQ